MANQNNKSLWPDFEDNSIETPKNILEEQGKFLSEQTKNILEVEISSTPIEGEDNKIVHHFDIVAPALNNYKYRLLSITHSIEFYPLDVAYKGSYQRVLDEDQFVKKLSSIFNDESTIRIIKSLIAQSK
jgi:hypothetical protein